MTGFIIYIEEKKGSIKNGQQTSPGLFRTVSLLILLLLLISFISSNPTRAYSESFWEEQQEKARHAVEKEPESLTANYQLAVTMANLGQIKEIDKKLNEFNEVEKEEFAEEIKPVFADNPENFDELMTLNFEAYYYVILEDYSQAAEIFDDIIKMDDKNIWARNFQAAVHIENDEPNTAQELLYENLEIEKEDYTYFLLGYVNYKEGRFFRALKYLSRARRVIFDLVF